MKEHTGRRNVEYLAEIGALGERFALNHCVHVNDDEIALIAESGSRVIHDPTSNMLLADGVAPVPAMRKAGIPTGLACDGPACNNTQDMFEVMKNASLLHKVTTGDAGVITAGDVSSMATREGAIAAGFGDRIGSLTPGKIADIVIIDTQREPPVSDSRSPRNAGVLRLRGRRTHRYCWGARRGSSARNSYR